MKNTLICTVGTSLINNILRSEDLELKEAWNAKNYTQAVLSLLKYDPNHRLCGAEINSNTSIFEKKLLRERQRLYLMLSDTEDGERIGHLLKKYYDHNRNPLKFERVECVRIMGLTDSVPHKFRTAGLKNLVKEIAKIVQKHSARYVLINATGGYKAQISFAGMIGQALQIPVCYLFEKFSEIIEMPPQPISFDLSFWLKNVWLFFLLDEGIENLDEVDLDPRFDTLIDRIVDKAETLTALSATGQLFHEAFKQHFVSRKEQFLPPDTNIAPQDKPIKYEDSNEGKHPGLKNYLEKLREFPYVKRIYTHYYNPDLPKKNSFRPSSRGDVSHIEGIYSDGKATTKFDLITTARTELERDAALADLLTYVKK